MMHQKTWLTVGVLAVFIGGVIGLTVWNETRPIATTLTPSTTSTPSSDTYTLAQIAEHGDAESCWTTIENNVYDLTEFIEEHPGGSKAILVICGSEGTGSFNSMPTVVMPAARLALAKYKIGELAQN